MLKKARNKPKAPAKVSLTEQWDAILKKWETVPKFAGKYGTSPTGRHIEKMERHATMYGIGPQRLKEVLAHGSRTGMSTLAEDLTSAEARIASLSTPGGSTALPAPKVYTGTKMIGIATMHKSNSVPVFSTEEAEELAKMRRG